MRSRSISVFLAMAATALGWQGVANAVELPPGETWKIEALPPALQAKVDEQDALWAKAFPGADYRGFFARVKIWPPDMKTIRVCFFGGSPETRATIARYANGWTKQQVRFTFDFGDPQSPRSCDVNDKEPSHIRVGFADHGYWSAVGQDAMILAGQAEVSLNLEDFDKKNIDHPYYEGVVLHEFGHALGLEHEHQNPLSNCEDEFDWEKIYEELAGPPNNWDKGIVDFNMRKLNAGNDLTPSTFDVNSIMLYSFKVEFYKKGKDSPCYTDYNDHLSEGDIQTIETMYPQEDLIGVSAYANLRAVMSGKTAETDRAAAPVDPTVRDSLAKYLPEMTAQ